MGNSFEIVLLPYHLLSNRLSVVSQCFTGAWRFTGSKGSLESARHRSGTFQENPDTAEVRTSAACLRLISQVCSSREELV